MPHPGTVNALEIINLN